MIWEEGRHIGRDGTSEEEREGRRGRDNSHGVEELLVFIISLVLADQHIQFIYQLILHLGTREGRRQVNE